SFTGTDYSSFGCGPARVLDDDRATSWSMDAPGSPLGGGPKRLVVELPADITITKVAIDPSSGCNDPVAAALRDFRVKAARDDANDPGTFTTIAEGTFGL